MVRKRKKNALVRERDRKKIAINTEKMQCLQPNVISTVAEETSKFARERINFSNDEKETKQKEKHEFPNSVMKKASIPSARIIIIIKYVLLRMALRFSSSDTMMEGTNTERKKSSSPESLHGNTLK
ncbi:hypothetical protein TNCV_894161 [Trichonephila clavipes]|nr:hypothetical protein TNCV_894161 [Trichonephila clavipes]